MPNQIKKAERLMANLKSELSQRLSGFTLSDGRDSSGNPLLLVAPTSAYAGYSATEQPNMLLRVKTQDNPGAKDALGLDQQVFAPHLLEALIQKTAAADTPAGNAPVDLAGNISGSNPSSAAAANLALAQSMALAAAVSVQVLDQANGTDAAVTLSSDLSAAVKRGGRISLSARDPLIGDV